MKQASDFSYTLFNRIYRMLRNKNADRVTFTQFIKHVLIGGSGVLLNYSIFNICAYSHLGTIMSNSIANAAVIVVTFLA